MGTDILKLTLNMLDEILESRVKDESQKLLPFEKYPKLESEERGQLEGLINGLNYCRSLIKTQTDMIDMANDFCKEGSKNDK